MNRTAWITAGAAAWLAASGCAPGYAPAGADRTDAALARDAGGDASGDSIGDGGHGRVDGADVGGADAPADAVGELADGVDAADLGGATGCSPDHDGEIGRREVTFRAGLTATYRVATDVPVDVHGADQPDGSRRWDLSGRLDGDHSVLVELRSLDGTWFKPDFPDAIYASKLSENEDELGIFGADESGLYLNGVVTPEDGLYKTQLAYEPPAQILKFPLAEGVAWKSDSDVSGTYLGNPWTSVDEEYRSQVDAHGTLETPFGEFPVLRVRTETERTVGFAMTTQITYTFVSECFGTVATIRSKENEGDLDFDEAAEVRRLAR